MNYSRFISAVSKARKPSPIREATALMQRSPPTMISLGSGAPNPSTFPFKSIEVEVTDGTSFKLMGAEMKRALQYSQSQGIPELLTWIKKFQMHFHQPPIMQDNYSAGFDACITAGSQDGLGKVLDMLLSPGDNLLVENQLYSGTLSYLKPLPVNLLAVEIDEYGMKPNSLQNILNNWKPNDASQCDSDIPKVIYTIPNCGNPTGASLSLERKKEIYEIAQKYDLVIVEDDPYYFLQFDTKDIAPSYQALDTDGRVIRSDSMSKVLSSGMRMGWISGPKAFLDRIILHQQVTVMHNSTLTQMLILKLLDSWNINGFEEHLQQVRSFYMQQRDAIVKSAEKHLTGLAEWNVPKGGMFLWIKILGIDDASELISKHAIEKEVILIPGKCFEVDENVKSPYCRASFSLPEVDKLDMGIQRLADIIQSELKSKR